jgi:DNA-binding transcriptional LysR family regulator
LTIQADDLFAGVLPFFYTAEERSFRRAAERLGVTPAAVSKAVLRLEDRLGVKLLVRTSRTVAMTPEGAAFQDRCREAIASLEAGREAVSEARRQPRGDVHLSMPFILGRIVVPALPRLAARYPNLRFRLSMTDRLVRLVDDQVDVAFRIGDLPDSRLVSRRLRGSRWVTVAAPSYIARAGRPAQPSDLVRHDLLVFVAPNGRPRAWSFRDPRTGAPIATPVEPRLLLDHGDHLLTAAIAGLGVCQVLDFMTTDPLGDGRLVEVLATHAAEGPPVHALTAPERSRAANVRAVMAFLAETFARA